MAGFLIAIISGALMSLQGAFNTNVTKASSVWVTAMFVQLTALATCAIMWVIDGRPDIMKLFKVDNKITLLGGVIGAFITFTVIKSISGLGIAKAEVTIVVAQIIVSYLLGLFGLFGSEKTTFSWIKLVSLLITVAGVCMFYFLGNPSTDKYIMNNYDKCQNYLAGRNRMEDLFSVCGKIRLRKGEGRTLKAGGAWVYDNEIEWMSDGIIDGHLVEVLDFDDYFMGIGFINRKSKITVRMLSRHTDVVDETFIEERVRAAVEYRFNTVDTSACRLIFGEADFLPGLVIDKYSDVLVVESLALGIDRFKSLIVEKVKEILREKGIDIRGVYERSDAKVRTLEGMERVKGFIGDEFDTNVEIVENGVHYMIDVVNGQKTGFFLDQKYNRLAMQKLCKDKRVLDCFTHMGTFALNAGIAGAKEVTGLDISEYAVEQARANAKLNGLENTVHFKCANVLDELPKLNEAGEKYDVVILDPPAFTKSREATKNAIKGYREINMKGLKLVKDGGYLASCSCSHFMIQELLTKTIKEAAKAVHKRLRQVEFRTQSPDHPILWEAQESYYLKFYIFQVVDEK